MSFLEKNWRGGDEIRLVFKNTQENAEGWHFDQRGRARLSERATPANQRGQAHPKHGPEITLCPLRVIDDAFCS